MKQPKIETHLYSAPTAKNDGCPYSLGILNLTKPEADEIAQFASMLNASRDTGAMLQAKIDSYAPGTATAARPAELSIGTLRQMGYTAAQMRDIIAQRKADPNYRPRNDTADATRSERDKSAAELKRRGVPSCRNGHILNGENEWCVTCERMGYDQSVTPDESDDQRRDQWDEKRQSWMAGGWKSTTPYGDAAAKVEEARKRLEAEQEAATPRNRFSGLDI